MTQSVLKLRVRVQAIQLDGLTPVGLPHPWWAFPAAGPLLTLVAGEDDHGEVWRVGKDTVADETAEDSKETSHD